MFYSVAFRSFRSLVTTPLLATIALMATVSIAPEAQAAALRLGRLEFSENSGDFRIVGGSRSSDTYTIQQEVFGPNVNLYMNIRGFRDLFRDGGAIWVQSIVTNLTGVPWILFDHELQERKGRPSPEEDGLSFAQGFASIRPFPSNRFSRTEEEISARDFVNFSGGIVQPGDTVTFLYAINDNSPINRFYLLQRPNFAPDASGFVQPPPPPPPSPPIVQPPVVQPPVVQPPVVEPPVVPPPVVEPPITQPQPPTPQPSPSVPAEPIVPLPNPPISSDPEKVAAIPEPTTVLGVLVAMAGGAWLKRTRSKA